MYGKGVYIENTDVIERWAKNMADRGYSLLFPSEKLEYKTLSQITMHDLGLDMICRQLSSKEAEQNYILRVMSQIYVDPKVTRYRCDIFEDILKHKQLRDDMMETLNRISFLKDYGSFRREYDEGASVWELMHRLDEIGDYIECVDALYACLEKYELHSDGFAGLREYVKSIYSDNGFGELKEDISNLKFDTSEIKSITVGINLNERFEAEGVGLISVNSKYFTRGGVLSNFYDHIMTRDKINSEVQWKGDYKFQPFDARSELQVKAPMQQMAQTAVAGTVAGAAAGIGGIPEGDQARDVTRYTDRVVGHMVSGIVKKMRQVLNKYVSITITDMTDLVPELMYYIRWAEYIEKLQETGAVFSKAKVVHLAEMSSESDSKVGDSDSRYYMKARGVYNIKLAAFDTEESEHIVTNDLDFDRSHRVYILTGANRGGKTTITQTIGQLFVMAQGGIYIPGDEFEFAPVDCVYTHFPADEDKTLDLGRLGEECKRFKDIFDNADEKSLILLNETFSTTSFEEGYYIAKDSVRAILAKGTRTIYNTHMHKLAFDVDEMNGDRTDGRAYSLIVHNEGSQRSYKIEIAPPAGKSYASDIAKKYGVTYDMLVNTEK